MKKLKCKRGFTLIEVMAVLILLGIVAAVAYGHFSSPINSQQKSSAATIVARDMNDLQKAVQNAQIATPPVATAAIVADPAGSLAPYLTSYPAPAAQVGGATAYTIAIGVAGFPAAAVIGKTSTTDLEACQAINITYATIAAPGNLAAVDATKDLQCVTAASPYLIYKKLSAS